MAHHRRDSTPASSSETASLGPSSAGAGGPGTKRKRLPACDCCKMRRLKCDPVPPPASCSRCKTTGVVCTTTPVVRKKPVPRSGKRIEEAKATFGTADPAAPDFIGASNTPWVQPRHHHPRTDAGPAHALGLDALFAAAGESVGACVREPLGAVSVSVSCEDVEARLAGQELDGALVAHLLEVYQTFPQSWLPIGVRGRLPHQFDAAGRRLEALPPQTEVLACVTIALASRLSSHPALFSPSPSPSGSSSSTPIPSSATLTPEVLATQPDLREFGQRREAMCERLRRHAVELAWRRGTLVTTCEESLASCYLLEMLEGYRDPAAGKPYGSAFVSHLQTILNGQDAPGAPLKVINMSLGWSALIMRETLLAATTGRTSHFTPTDDLLLCGEVPCSIEDALLKSVDDVDVRDSVTLFFSPMRPFTYHVARLARECGEKISGTAARRQPLNEPFVAQYLTQLDHLLHLFAILESRIAYVLSPAATAAHALPAPFEAERTFIMRACLHTLGLAWAALCLPVRTELARRLALLCDDTGAGSGAGAHAADRRRATERLELLRRQVDATALKAARMVAQCVREAPSLAFLTQLRSENLERWVEVLRDARAEEDGGEGISREDRERDLRWLLGGLKTMGWSWTDHAPLIATIEHALDDLAREDHAARRHSAGGTPASGVAAVKRASPPPPAPSLSGPPAGGFSAAPPFATGSYAASSPSYALPHPPSFSAGAAPPPPPPPPPPPHASSSAAAMSPFYAPSLPHGPYQAGHGAATTPHGAPPLPSPFIGAPTPPSQHAHHHHHHQQEQEQEQPRTYQHQPQPQNMPDLFELVSLYSGAAGSGSGPGAAGGLDPLMGSGSAAPAGSAGMDVNALAAQYLDGTFDLPLLGGYGHGHGSAGQPHGQGQEQGQAQGAGGGAGVGEFDLESLLAEPVFAATPGAQGA